MNCKIGIYDCNNNIIGYWRKFNTGEVAVYPNETVAERIISTWEIDGRVIDTDEPVNTD